MIHSLIAGEDLNRGDIVHLEYMTGTIYKFGKAVRPIAVAARDVKQGEVIKFDPESNTDDLVIRTEGKAILTT